MPFHSIKLLATHGVLVWSVSLPMVLGQNQSPTAAQPASLLPPMPPPAQSGIAYFRELLEAKPEQREKLLAGKNPQYRAVLEDGVRRYEALSPEERELRLRTMELRFYVTSLLRVAPSNRADRLKRLVPERERPLVEDRLNYWDRLSAADQKKALENEQMTRAVVGIVGPPASHRQIPLNNQTSNQVRQIEEQFIRWQEVPNARRAKVQMNFANIFELTDAEKHEILSRLHLNDEERQLMENTLARFKQLTPSQRSACVQNFSKLASLSPPERREFLVNAEEWQKMKPSDREAWRKLVSQVPPMPPLPHSRLLPPYPPGLRPPRPNTTTALKTN